MTPKESHKSELKYITMNLIIIFKRLVLIGPGAIQFTVILNDESSLARTFENPSTPAFVAT